MSDFAQNGAVCTLQRLNDAHLEPLSDQWLPDAATQCPITIILPCHAPDLGTPALSRICQELSLTRWTREVIIPINGLPPDSLPGVRQFFQQNLSHPHTLLPTDSGKLPQLLAEAAGGRPETLVPGKGLNVWAAVGVAYARATPGALALQDCDVLSFQRAALGRLCFAVADSSLEFDFSKMYYSRVSDRLYGRVSRLFLTPLLHALVRVAGHHPLLHFLLSFRYPLAGECALSMDLATQIPLHCGWALEIGMLSDVFRTLELPRICQVDGGSGYDHKHQPAAERLTGMCQQIAVCLLHQLAREGCEMSPSFLNALSGALKLEAQEATRRFHALSKMNGLNVPLEQEQALARQFALCLPSSLPDVLPPLPPWNSVPARLLEKLHDWSL
jgi:glucosyl-3-phosphoglycerate synthase